MAIKKRVPKGVKMTRGPGWLLTTTKGRVRKFRGNLLGTINWGSTRIAMFRVTKK